VLGGAGGALGEAIEQGYTAFKAWRFTRGLERMPLGQRLSAYSNAWVGYGHRGITGRDFVVGLANAGGITVSNSGPFISQWLPVFTAPNS
jgi:hypothetical protein